LLLHLEQLLPVFNEAITQLLDILRFDTLIADALETRNSFSNLGLLQELPRDELLLENLKNLRQLVVILNLAQLLNASLQLLQLFRGDLL